MRPGNTWSRAGSICGETLASRRSMQSCTLRSHTVAGLAEKLRQQSFDSGEGKVGTKLRFNSSFHHYRFIVVMMAGFSVGLMYMLRYSITVSILKMVNQTALYLEEHPSKTYDDFIAEGYKPGGEFDWNHKTQQMIMSGYMITYTLPQFLTTKCGKIIGAKWAIPLFLVTCAASAIPTPIVAYWGWQWVLVMRLINGLGASAVLPMFINCVESWMPYDQTSLGLTLGQFTQAIISTAIPLFAGELAAIHWSWAFYGPAVIAIAFSFIWIFLVTDRPDENWLVSERELERICGCSDEHDNCTSNSKKATRDDEDEKTPQEPVSLLQILGQHTIYSYMILWSIYCCTYTGFFFVLPIYLKQVLKTSVSEVGFYCTVVQSGCLIAVLWPHLLLTLLSSKLSASEIVARKVTCTVICGILASTFYYMSVYHEYQLIIIFLNRCCFMSYDIVLTGALIVNYSKSGMSSLVFSLINTVGNLTTVLASASIGWTLDYTGASREGWCWVLLALGSAQLVLVVVFALTINGEPIEFNSNKKENLDVEEPPINPTSNVKIMDNFDVLKAENGDNEKGEEISE